MTTKKVVSVSVVDEIRAAFESAPDHQADEIHQAEAVRRLIPQILVMRTKGYNFADIASMLSQYGIEIGPTALRAHLRNAKLGIVEGHATHHLSKLRHMDEAKLKSRIAVEKKHAIEK